MKLQIWKIYVSEGVIGAIHGQSYPIYEGFVPDLKLTVNQLTSFVNESNSRYKSQDSERQEGSEPLLVDSPPPKMICELELSRAQIEDVRCLANEASPENRIRQLIATTLKDKNLDASDYDDDDDEQASSFQNDDEDEDE